ncbi:hypothetical protein [Terrisporobacter petrolearius]|uniref:hypothetical protein n=1 Tax=Terrisporobacter petrolearius TaxID=1460447 RepID=UPI0029303AFC|nr:hypothetical protein [Terrisporobacter petrolearius]
MFISCVIIAFKISQRENITIKKIKNIVFFSMLGILVYELEQLFSNMTFDFFDVISTILGGIVIFFILKKWLITNYT